MSKFFIAQPDGTITHTGQCPDSMLSVQAQAPDVVVIGECDLHTDMYNHKTKKLEKRLLSNAELWQPVRRDRAMRLHATDGDLQALLLPDSFPTLTTTQKQTKIDALTLYRQALRDVTRQPDPANIAWPTPPGVI